ncbi:MAG: limonene-1,2-epoxide hydrolase family protein [Pseudomonadales bacterium]
MNPSQTVHAFLSAMERMDYDTALQHVADDVEYINGSSPAVSGPEGIRRTLEPFFAPLKKNEFKVLREASNGNVVIIERLDRHLADHGWFELPVTGVMEVENGKITYWREYFDLAVIQGDIAKLMVAS